MSSERSYLYKKIFFCILLDFLIVVWTGFFLYNWSFQSLVCDWIKLEKIVFTLLNTFNCLEFHDLIVLFYIRALWMNKFAENIQEWLKSFLLFALIFFFGWKKEKFPATHWNVLLGKRKRSLDKQRLPVLCTHMWWKIS